MDDLVIFQIIEEWLSLYSLLIKKNILQSAPANEVP